MCVYSRKNFSRTHVITFTKVESCMNTLRIEYSVFCYKWNQSRNIFNILNVFVHRQSNMVFVYGICASYFFQFFDESILNVLLWKCRLLLLWQDNYENKIWNDRSMIYNCHSFCFAYFLFSKDTFLIIYVIPAVLYKDGVWFSAMICCVLWESVKYL